MGSMQFIRSDSEEDGAAALAQRLRTELKAGKKVAWLTSGGSNIPISVRVMSQLEADLTKNLTVMPADERYGPVDHIDSNWTQLMQAGFETKRAKLISVLQDGLSLEATSTRFSDLAEETFTESDVTIAQMGLGTDGHIIGILPNTPAASETAKLTIGYKGPTYEDRPAFERITLTPAALTRLTSVYLFAYGASKVPVLKKLKTHSIDPIKMPVGRLKDLPEVYIFNEQVGN